MNKSAWVHSTKNMFRQRMTHHRTVWGEKLPCYENETNNMSLLWRLDDVSLIDIGCHKTGAQFTFHVDTGQIISSLAISDDQQMLCLGTVMGVLYMIIPLPDKSDHTVLTIPSHGYPEMVDGHGTFLTLSDTIKAIVFDGALTAITLCADSIYLFVAVGYAHIHMWDIKNQKHVQTLHVPHIPHDPYREEKEICALYVSNDKRYLVARTLDFGDTHVWDILKNTIVWANDCIPSKCLDPDKRLPFESSLEADGWCQDFIALNAHFLQ
jgi:hypothetical protein